MYLLFPFIFDICSKFHNYISNSNLNLMLFHWFYLLLYFLLEIFLISKFFLMINFLVHWSTYSIIFQGRYTNSMFSEALCIGDCFFLCLPIWKLMWLGLQFWEHNILPHEIIWTIPHWFPPVFILKRRILMSTRLFSSIINLFCCNEKSLN